MDKPQKVIEKILGINYKKNDKDTDGAKDKIDCQPNNPMRQDAISKSGLGRIQRRLDSKPY